jgi:hypothetical protein
MKTILLFFFLLMGSKFSFGQHLKIELFNKTGYDLDSVSIGNEGFVKIKKDSSVVIHGCKDLSMMGGLPIGNANGKIYEKKRDTRFLGICGTGNKRVRKGHFQFDIIMVDGENGYRLFYQTHKKSKTIKAYY